MLPEANNDQNNVVSHIQPWGGVLEKELQYQGSPEEIAAQIERDENALLEYMTTGDDMGQKSFVFAGFMFRKDMIEAAQMTEPEF